MERREQIKEPEIYGLKSLHWQRVCVKQCRMSSLAIYIVGFIILIGGLAYGASMAGLATQWIVVGVLVLMGIGVVLGVTRTRQKDPSHD